MNLWYLYDNTTGVIQQTQTAQSNPWDNPPASWSVYGPVGQNTASATEVMAYNFPERFLITGSPVALVEQPYLTLTSAANGNTVTLTATLNNPPSVPPTSATFTLANGTETATLTNNTATLTIDVHPSVANAPINVTVGASGCATSRPVNIGGQASIPVALQVYTPSGGNPTVAPTGTGSKAYLAAYYATSPASLTSMLADIGTSNNMHSDIVYRKTFAALRVLANLYEWATKLPTNPYAPTTQDTTDITNVQFTADEASAADDINTSVLPSLFTTLANAFPSGGTKQIQYADMVGDLAKTYDSYMAYGEALSIPNLA